MGGSVTRLSLGRRLVNLLPVAQRTNAFTLSYRGKRPIDYPAQSKPYNILPPLERRDLWDVSVDGSPYTVVPAYPNFDPNPGEPGRHVYNETHAQAFLLKEMFEVRFELVSCRRRQM